MSGVPGTSKKQPYAGPMYSEGTPQQDSKSNMGKVHGPVDMKGAVPDILDYVVDEDKAGGRAKTK